MEYRREGVGDRKSIGTQITLLTLAGLSGEGGLGRTKQVVARSIGDKSPVRAVIRPGCKDLGQA